MEGGSKDRGRKNMRAVSLEEVKTHILPPSFPPPRPPSLSSSLPYLSTTFSSPSFPINTKAVLSPSLVLLLTLPHTSSTQGWITAMVHWITPSSLAFPPSLPLSACWHCWSWCRSCCCCCLLLLLLLVLLLFLWPFPSSSFTSRLLCVGGMDRAKGVRKERRCYQHTRRASAKEETMYNAAMHVMTE